MESVVEGRPRHQRENDRLNVQHEIVKGLMGGKLLCAPVDLSQPKMKVLDSGTAQANWLLDFAEQTPSTTQLIGTDIAPEQFPAESQRPSNMILQTQSIFEAWPHDFQSSFDIVHQRFVLAACKSDEQAVKAIGDLVGLAKPGAWVEFHEGNMIAIQEGPSHKSMVRFRDLAVGAWRKIGNIPDPGPRLSQWLKEAGVLDIQEEKQVVKIGATADDAKAGQNAVDLCMNMFDAIQRIMAGKSFFSSSVRSTAITNQDH